MTEHLNLKTYILFLFIFSSINLFPQSTSISYESNSKISSLESNNPFVKFFGEWTLKNDDWSQNWGYGTEHIKIPKHHTISKGINTKNSLLSIIDGPEPNGHILWSYNPNTKEVHHLSSFGEIRAGNGKGTIDKNGNVTLKLFFEGEPKGTYRRYTYSWVNDNEYKLKSTQFDENDKPTGLFYGGTFIRFQTATIENQILHHGEVIRKAFSEGDIETIEALHHPAVVKALGYTDIKTGRDEVIVGIAGTLENYNLEFIANEVESILIDGNIAIEQTKFAIKGTPKKGGDSFIFKGRTMVTYLKYKESPTGWATIREIIQVATE